MKIDLMQGDCLELMKTIPDESVDLVLCDPPYGTTACKWDSVIPLEPMWKELKRVTRKDSAIVLFASQPFTSLLVSSNFEMFKYQWYWNKNKSTGFLNAKKQPLRRVEDICVKYTKQPVYNAQKSQGGKPVNNFYSRSAGSTTGKVNNSPGGGQTDRYPVNTLDFPVLNNDGSKGERFHPTQKPVELMEYLIKTYTNEGMTVLDFTMGSGTTGVACKNLNRNFIGIEKDEKYFQIASDRINY